MSEAGGGALVVVDAVSVVQPEITSGIAYDESVDVYSFGLVLLDMAVEEPLLDFIGERWRVDFGKKQAPKQVSRLKCSTGPTNSSGTLHYRIT